MYTYPVDNPKVTCAFGVVGSYWAAGWHIGTDYSNLNNNYIYSISTGIVTGVNNLTGTSYGNHIEVTHTDGLVAFYAHLDEIFVSVGESVVCGDIIATMGSTGTTAKHLHIELHKDAWKYPSKGVEADWLLDPDAYITEYIEANAPSSWAEAAWNWAIDLGITDGTNPKGYITREQVVTMLYRAIGDEK